MTNNEERLNLVTGSKFSNYVILDNVHSSEKLGRFARPLGSGATSVVYVCEQEIQKGSVSRAIKIMKPSEDLVKKRQQANLTVGINAFWDEVGSLTTFNHQNLVRIIDAGTFKEMPYLVMDLVNGNPLSMVLEKSGNKTINDWFREKVAGDPWILVRVVRQVLWALEYLHEREFFHMDVAPKNIFIEEISDRPHVVLGDIGVGKFLRLDALPSANIPVAGTRAYAWPSVDKELNKGHLPASKLREIAPYWDVRSSMLVLKEMAKEFGIQFSGHLKPIGIYIDQIVSCETKISAADLASEFGRLMPDQVTTAGLPELSANSIGSKLLVSIPLYSVPLTDRISRIVGHPMFARLRLVPQLLLVRTVYPGGIHSRFEHVLGSYELARRTLLHLLAQPEFRFAFKQADLEEALLCVLLTHLVSYPLHHVFEEVFPDHIKRFTTPSGPVTLFDWFLDYKFPRSPEEVDSPTLRELIVKLFPAANLEKIRDVIRQDGVATPTTTNSFLKMLVRSSVDVRVMDYLVRDAHHTGVNAGTNVDIDHIISNFVYMEVNQGLALASKGVHALENLLCARYWMYSRVYWNAISRSLFAMLRYVVSTLVMNKITTIEELIEKFLGADEHGVLRHLDELWKKLPVKYREIKIISLLSSPRPKYYYTLHEYAQYSAPAGVIDRFRGFSNVQLEAVRQSLLDLMKNEFGLKINDGDLLIDVPREAITKCGEDIDVYVDKNSSNHPLVRTSEIVKALPDTFLAGAMKLRVFGSLELSGLIKEQCIPDQTISDNIAKILQRAN